MILWLVVTIDWHWAACIA